MFFVGVKVTRACGFESCPTIVGVLGQEEKMAREQANCILCKQYVCLLWRYHSHFSLSRFPRYLSWLKSQSNGISRIRQSGSAWTKWSLRAWMACEEHHLLVVWKFKVRNRLQKHIKTVLASEASDGIWAQQTDLFLLWQEAAKDKAFRVSLSKTFDAQENLLNFWKDISNSERKSVVYLAFMQHRQSAFFLTQPIFQDSTLSLSGGIQAQWPFQMSLKAISTCSFLKSFHESTANPTLCWMWLMNMIY